MQDITLILATVGRVEPLHKFFRSLLEQGADLDITVILVDQNPDDRLRGVYLEYAEFVKIIWIASPTGLSKARNVGINCLNGAGIVGFPDDDCIYPAGFLSDLLQTFNKLNADFITVNQFSEQGETDTRPPPKSTFVTRYNVWRACGSIRTFYTGSTIKAVGHFDEKLGLGSGTPWKGGEDIDYPIRVLALGATGWFENSLHVIHESSRSSKSPGTPSRIFGYNASMGLIWRKHNYPLWWLAYQCSRSAAGILIALARLDASEAVRQAMSLSGRIRGCFTRGVCDEHVG